MKGFVAAALAAGLVGPASAATVLDFTKDDAISGTVGTVSYDVSATDATNDPLRVLSNSRHDVDLGCEGTGWNFDCRSVGGKYDVGFGVVGRNPSEIDATNPQITPLEYVQVTFDGLVKILGFAGMLAYNGSQPGEGTEKVVLEYSADGGVSWAMVDVLAFNDDNDPTNSGNDNFDTVGLAWLKTGPLLANVVRFTAGGRSPFDDTTANVTAAGLLVAPVPVPASLPLLVAGLGALGFMARRKRKSA